MMIHDEILSSLFDRCEELDIPITLADPLQDDSPLIFANTAFTKLTGYPRSEIIGKNCRFLQGDRTNPEDVKKMRNEIAARSKVSTCILNYRADGSMFHNMVFVSHVELADDRPLLVGSQFEFNERFLPASIDSHVAEYEHVEQHFFSETKRYGGIVRETLKMRAESAALVVQTYIALSKKTFRPT